jgi:hypothetical protein
MRLSNKCQYCGLTFYKASCVALLIDLGVQTNIDPINCSKSPDGKHHFSESNGVKEIAKPTEY